MCSTKSSTATQSRSATVACLTSNRRLMVTTNPPYRKREKRLSTELSKHVWHLKEARLNFKITRKILKQTSSYSPASNRCNLCLWEKYCHLSSIELSIQDTRACQFCPGFIFLSQCSYDSNNNSLLVFSAASDNIPLIQYLTGLQSRLTKNHSVS